MLLELFRNHKRWLMFIAMILVIPSFVVTGIYSYNRMMSDDGAIAKVDDVSITPQQYDEVKRQQLKSAPETR
ncbi:MAG: SurA N-terminal domain-containing protein [Duodenibacillus massiliensis]